LGGSEENLPESSPGLQTAPAVHNIQIKHTLNYPSQIRPLSRHYLHVKIRKKSYSYTTGRNFPILQYLSQEIGETENY
jgi:hypothetical protein